MDDCTICCEKYNQTSRKKVICNYCDLSACRVCVQRVLLDSTVDPHCMQCNNAWNREFIDNSCTKSFRNGALKLHRENILFEREKCFLPDAQQVVALRKEGDKKLKQAETVQNEIYKLQRTLFKLTDEAARLKGTTVVEKKERKEFIKKCPVTDCRGFLSTQWKCDVCDNKICKECNEIKKDDHECDPDTVETIALIKKDTKGCPSCGTMIFKISGCAQMWCPDCHTAFNWSTLEIEKGIVHNPHYYEFQRKNGGLARQPGDEVCGGLPYINDLYLALGVYNRNLHNMNHHQQHPQYVQDIVQIHRIIGHLPNNEMYRYRNPRDKISYEELRIKYLMNDIDEKEFKKILQQRDKRREKYRDILNVFEMFIATATDLIRQLVADKSKKDEVLLMFENLRLFVNKSFEEVKERYSCVSFEFTERWYIDKIGGSGGIYGI